ncbi:MAG: hypothetical protein AAGI92_09690, partial [Pseudomonadota bacterium]
MWVNSAGACRCVFAADTPIFAGIAVSGISGAGTGIIAVTTSRHSLFNRDVILTDPLFGIDVLRKRASFISRGATGATARIVCQTTPMPTKSGNERGVD